jgi:hypothetical protein
MRIRGGRGGRSMILLRSLILALEEVAWRRSLAAILLLYSGGM